MNTIEIPSLHGTRITSVTDFEKFIPDIQWTRFVSNRMENYRGHSLREYKLIPGISRGVSTLDQLSKIEMKLCEEFIEKVKENEIGSVREPFKDEYLAKMTIRFHTYSFHTRYLPLKC